MGTRDVDAMRMLVRHQWVREHGTPRVTTLAGRPATSRALWLEWMRLTGRSRAPRNLFEQPARASARWIESSARKAMQLATTSPRDPVAIVVEPALLSRWFGASEDRLSAFIGEGIVEVGGRGNAAPGTRDGRSPRATRADLLAAKARSLAELTFFEALEATPATAGRFALNQPVSFHFGARAAEIDLLSRDDELALEVDGYHHFTTPEGYRRDRRKDLVLQANGYAVLRFLADDVLADPRAAVQLVVEFLGHRLAQRRMPRRRDHAS